MAKKVPQLIEQQIQFWMRKESADKPLRFPNKKLPVITVSREFGAKGAALATELGNKLGFKVWDNDLLTVISENIGSNKDFIALLDESRRNLLEDTIFGFINHRETNLSYLIFLVKAVRALEKFGNNIIVGRGANFICQNKNSFHVRVVCPFKIRVQNYARDHQVPKNEASDIILKKDADRENFTSYNFNRDISNSSEYDLTINSDTYTMAEMVELVIRAYELKTAVNLSKSKKAAII